MFFFSQYFLTLNPASEDALSHTPDNHSEFFGLLAYVVYLISFLSAKYKNLIIFLADIANFLSVTGDKL